MPVEGETKVNTELTVVQFEKGMGKEEILRELESRSLRPATLAEAMEFSAQDPNEQLRGPIIALGSSWTNRETSKHIGPQPSKEVIDSWESKRKRKPSLLKRVATRVIDKGLSKMGLRGYESAVRDEYADWPGKTESKVGLDIEKNKAIELSPVLTVNAAEGNPSIDLYYPDYNGSDKAEWRYLAVPK